MGIERSRVLEVHRAQGAVGAGYLIDDRLVLTAGAGRARAEVRPAGTATWLAASPVWSTGAALFAGAELVGVLRRRVVGRPGLEPGPEA